LVNAGGLYQKLYEKALGSAANGSQRGEAVDSNLAAEASMAVVTTGA